MLFGSRLNRLATSIRRGISKYSVGSDNPGLVFDFIDNFYQKDKNQTVNFDGAITHARSGNAVMTDGYGPELVTNGGFDSDSDWTKGTGWSISDGVATKSAGTASNLQQDSILTSGKTYVVEFTVSNRTAGQCRVFAASGGAGTFRNDNGTFSEILTATGANFWIYADSSFNGSIDNVSVREMPVLKWAPHNLLSYSEEFDSGSWNLSAQGSGVAPILTPNYGLAPNGTMTAYRLQCSRSSSGSADRSRIQQSVSSVPIGSKLTNGIWIKSTDGTSQEIQIQDSTENNSLSSVTVGAEWQLVGTEYDVSLSTTANFWVGLLNSSVTALTSDVLIWGAHLYRSDLGGMVDNPDRGDSYVPTAGRATGPEVVTNGTFDNDISDWTETDTNNHVTPSYNNGKLRLTSTTNTSGAVWMGQTLSNLTTGQTYIVTADITITGTATASVILHNPYITSFPTITSSGRYHFTFKPTATSHEIRALVNAGFTSGSTVDFDNISLRKSTIDPSVARYLPRIGHHVYNGSAWVNEGLLAESEARTNLITDSFDFSAWNGVGTTVTSDDAVSPEGTESADAIFETTATSEHYRQKSVTSLTGTYTFSVYLKAAGSTQYVILGERSTTAAQASFDLTNGTVENTSLATATIQNIGNGWYRCSLTPNASLSNQSFGSRIQPDNNGVIDANNYAGNTSNGVYAYGAQLEQASTPSSLVPTSGSSVTRAAESFTIPSANLPWPSPNYIGSELVTNGTFDTDSDWTKASNWSIGSGVATSDGGSGLLQQTTTVLDTSKVYLFEFEITSYTSGSVKIYSGAGGDPTDYVSAVGSYSFAFSPLGTTPSLFSNAFNGSVDSVSVREINPLSVSIAMDGRISHRGVVDTFFRWREDGNNYINNVYWTDYRFITAQKDGTTYDQVASDVNLFSGDLLEPYNTASRHGSTFINGAVDGVALTEDTTPTLLTDLSATDLELAFGYMGTIGTFRVWDKDLGDDGLVEATNPSLEPSLSLTFEGTGTNSFVVNNWSE